ncbi:MAG: T9SS type A sorting domain-containing protein [Bacteroidetes bacterium]|nr:T9SS type A sorting domain-containing protein [Bacteroidota bacterium]
MVVLHGNTANTSKVLICFSKSNNPMDGWWVYEFDGNALNNNCWFDYPQLGVSNNEVFITGNLFQSGGGPFNQAIIFQMDKTAGYNGTNINWVYYYGLNANPFPAFTLVPASNGQQGNYGPGIYLVSNNSGGASSIILWDITSDIAGSPNLNSYSINTTAYSLAGDAQQLGNGDLLDNGDCRIQSAFYLNGKLHFTFHSDIGNGWNGINYNRLTVSSLTNQSTTFGLSGSYDYSYPSVASFSNNNTNHSVMISFLRSSDAIYPEQRVVNCDDALNWSASTLVKSGETFVNIVQGKERWGDYTGISRKHNAGGDYTIWLSGCYGADIPNENAFNTYKTWIAEVKSGTPTSTSNKENNILKPFVYPNPVYDILTIKFNNISNEILTIVLKDSHGKILKTLFKDVPKQGDNMLTLNRKALSSGLYYICFYNNLKLLQYEKVIVSD